MKARQPRCEQLYDVGEELIASKHQAGAEIRSHITSVKDKWQRLLDLVAKRRARLDDAHESHQVCTVTHTTVTLYSNRLDHLCIAFALSLCQVH